MTNSGEQFWQPGGVFRRGRREETERRPWAFYRGQEEEILLFKTREIRDWIDPVSGGFLALEVEDGDVTACVAVLSAVGPACQREKREERRLHARGLLVGRALDCYLGCCWACSGWAAPSSFFLFFHFSLFCFLISFVIFVLQIQFNSN